MDALLSSLREFAVDTLPVVVAPVAVILVGWAMAVILASTTRRALQRTSFDERLVEKIVGEHRARRMEPAKWLSRGVYYLVLLLTLLAFLEVTNLTTASEPVGAMLSSVMAYLPLLIAAAAILFVAWVAATLVRTLMVKILDHWELDRRVERTAITMPGREEWTEAELEETAIEGDFEGEETPVVPTRAARGRLSLSRAISETAYWLVLILFVPAVLETLRLEGLLRPVQGMLTRVLEFLPNVASALLIAGVGWLAARITQRLIANALSGLGLDRFAERVSAERLFGEVTLSSLVGFIAYVLILIPVAIGALNALQLEAITVPASSMLEMLLGAVPAIFGAALVVAFSYIGGRLLGSAASRVLAGVGFDTVLSKLGIARSQIAKRTPSELAGGFVMIAVIYFGALEGARLLEFSAVAALGSDFAALAGHVLLGLVIFGLGLYFGKLAAEAIEDSGVSQPRVLAVVTRIAIVGLAGAMGLRQMGIADEIIELAFGLTVGACAVAAALAFGLGGRDSASRLLEDMRERLNEERTEGMGAHSRSTGGERASG